MTTDYDIALLLQDQYDNQVNNFDCFSVVNEVSFAVKHLDDCTAICFEGSHNLPDFERDFSAEMTYIPGLGGVHSGFYYGLPDVLRYINDMLPTDKLIKVCGHSLGGGEAHIFMAMLAKQHYTFLEAITFGSPLPGDITLASIIEPFPNRSYWNYRNPFQHDIVGSVPLWLPNEKYVMPTQRILIDEAPELIDPWGVASWHHFNPLYMNGVKKLCDQKLT